MNLLNLYIKCIHLHVNKYMYTHIYECIYIPKNIHISDFITGIRKYNFKRINIIHIHKSLYLYHEQ